MENKVITSEELERLKEIEKKQKERYRKQNLHTNSIYDRINFTVPVGKKKELEELAKQENKTLNKFISEVVLLTLVNNDVNNALNNNTYSNENIFIIPEELNDKIKIFSDDVIGYITAAIYEKLELDEQIAMDLESEQKEEERAEQPQIEPIAAPTEEMPAEKEESHKSPTIEQLQEWQAQLMAKKAEQDKREEEQKKRKEEQEEQEKEERKAELMEHLERIRNGEPIEEDEEKEELRKDSMIKANIDY